MNDYLQLESYPNIFAAGDITNFKEEKLAERALKQAEVVVENLLNVAKGLLPKSRYYIQQKPGISSTFLWIMVIKTFSFLIKRVASD